jgi:hypothetical protein
MGERDVERGWLLFSDGERDMVKAAGLLAATSQL